VSASNLGEPNPGALRRFLGLPPIEPATSAPRRSLTAASIPVSQKKIKRNSLSPEAWQQEAIALYSEVGELRYVANATGNAASRAYLYVGKWEAGSEEPVEQIAGVAVDAFHQFGGGPLGRAELIKRMFIQLFVPGEGFIVGFPPGVLDDGQDQIPTELVRMMDLTWHVAAGTEVKVAPTEITIDFGDRPRKFRPDEIVLVRAWRPNPFRWWQSDSPVRSNLPVLRELVGLTKHVSASIDSRLAGAGVLLLGDSFSLMAGQSPDPDDAPETDPILSALMDAMVTSIRDRDSASAVMPILLQGPDEAIDKVQHLTFSTPFDAQTKDLRDEAIRRLALGLDAPPEVLLGLGTSTHWNAWIIQDDTVRTHIDPALSLICDALTTDFLWPVLRDANVPDWAEYAIWWDTSALTQRADRSAEAIQLFDRGELTGDALRRETGFDDTDAPETDRVLELARRLVEAAPALLTDPGVEAVIEQVRLLTGDATTGPIAIDVPVPDDEPDVPVEDLPDTIDDVVTAAAVYPDDAPGGGLPPAYRPATSDDVPDGRACGNCNFYDERVIGPDGIKAYCTWWQDFVDGGFYCNAWAEIETDDADNGV
jgi:hypothetical protein